MARDNIIKRIWSKFHSLYMTIFVGDIPDFHCCQNHPRCETLFWLAVATRDYYTKKHRRRHVAERRHFSA